MYFDRRLYDLQQLATRTPEEQTEREAFRAKLQEEADASWRRRMAMRTPEEIERGVVAL